MYHTIIIVGNVGKDPEMRYTPSGQAVTSFSVATNRQYTASSGEQVKETIWFRISAWGKQAEICNQYLAKGRLVMCEGEIRTSTYTDQNGAERNGWELRANIVKFLGGTGDRGPAGAFDDAGAGHGESHMAEDDIPF